MKPALVAQAVDFHVNYLNFLGRQPLFIAYVREMSELAQTRLEAMFSESVDVIAEVMQSGSEDGKLKAVKLQGELTGRIGRNEGRTVPQPTDRLPELAERLVSLLQSQRKRVYENAEDAKILPEQ